MSRTRSTEHITPVLRRLHWLPIRQRISYKILLITYKALNGMAPKYLADLLQCYQPSRNLRSSSTNPLVVPNSNLKTYGDRAFNVAVPKLWNSLPANLRSISSSIAFKNTIKTLLFNGAFNYDNLIRSLWCGWVWCSWHPTAPTYDLCCIVIFFIFIFYYDIVIFIIINNKNDCFHFSCYKTN